MGVALGVDDSSPTAVAEPQPRVQQRDAAALLFDDWAFRLGRGEWPDPNSYLDRAGDNAGDLRLLMDTYIRAQHRPAPTQRTSNVHKHGSMHRRQPKRRQSGDRSTEP